MSENETIGCIALVAMFVPLIALIIALVQVHKLKAAVRNLVSRVAQLEHQKAVTPPDVAAGVSPAQRGGAERVTTPPATTDTPPPRAGPPPRRCL